MWLTMCILTKHISTMLTQITIFGTIITTNFDVDPKYADSNYDQTIIPRRWKNSTPTIKGRKLSYVG